MGRNQRDETGVQFAFTSWTNDPSISCDGAAAELGDGLGTLAKDLIERGIINGTVSA